MSSEHFTTNGFALVPDVIGVQECAVLAQHASAACANVAGSRCLLSQPWCADLVPRLRAHPALSALMPEPLVAVQCTYFEKSAALNWLVPIHQDLSIPVAQRVSHPELRGWSVKEGALFVQPPASLLERMLAVRLHLDDCAEADGPLRVVPGSHLSGIVSPQDAIQARSREITCTAKRGTTLAMRPLLLHTSSKSSGSSLRRVLHFLFGPAALPHGLSWQNAV